MGFEIHSSVNEQERIVLQVDPAKWIAKHLQFGSAIMSRHGREF